MPVALLLLSSGYNVIVIVLWLFLTVPWVGMQCVIVVFPDHTTYFFLFFYDGTDLVLTEEQFDNGFLHLIRRHIQVVQLNEFDINPFKRNGISHLFKLEQSFSNFRVLGGILFLFFQILIEYSVSKRLSSWCLIWICTIYLRPIKRTPVLYGLKYLHVLI